MPKINTKHLYKIWFSETPSKFLPLEKCLDLIRLREKNPKAMLTLVYSSACLDQTALTQLNNFCRQHHIIALDFDTHVEQRLEREDDKKLFKLAQAELSHLRNNTGGDARAASYLARLITPIIEFAGNYTDFDVSVDLSAKPKWVDVTSPLVLNSLPFEDRFVVNPDVLFVARQAPSNHCAPDATQKLESIKSQIIGNYQNPFPLFENVGMPVAFMIKGTPYLNPQVPISQVLKHGGCADLFAIRQMLKKIHNLQGLFPMSVIAACGYVNYKTLSSKTNAFGIKANDLTGIKPKKTLPTVMLTGTEIIQRSQDTTPKTTPEQELLNAGKTILNGWQAFKASKANTAAGQLVPTNEHKNPKSTIKNK